MSCVKRTQIIAGNWKMYKTPREACEYLAQFVPQVVDHPEPVYLAVPAVSLLSAVEATKGTNVYIGAQNMHEAESGAFTGEISASMIADCGAHFVLLGHSERRHLYGEEDTLVNRKVRRALEAKLQPVVCIGETQEQRKANQTAEVLKHQLQGSLAELSAEQLSCCVIAYEPVWAIGTGQTATPEIAQETHSLIRSFLASHWGKDLAEKIVLQYGGSVKPDTASALMAQIDIDGLLVGGASLSVDSFVQIVHHTALISGN